MSDIPSKCPLVGFYRPACGHEVGEKIICPLCLVEREVVQIVETVDGEDEAGPDA